MPTPKSGRGGGRNLRPRPTNGGVSKTPKGRVGDKANESGDRFEGQESTAGRSQPDQASTEDLDMNDAPPIDDQTELVSDSSAEPNSPSAESTPARSDSTSTASTPAQSNSPSNESTPARSNSTSTASMPTSAHKPPGGNDPDEVVLFHDMPSVHYITNKMKKMRVVQDDEHLLAIVPIGRNMWQLLGFGPHNLRDYAMATWKSYKDLETYTLSEYEKKLVINPIPLKKRRERGENMKAFGGVAMRGDIGLLIPKAGESWPPPNIRILVKWEEENGQDVVESSWETYSFAKTAWQPLKVPYLDPEKAKLESTRSNGKICRDDKVITILKDIPVGRRVLKKDQKLTTFHYALIDAAVRCRQRYDEGLISKDKSDVAKRYATPAFKSDGNRDSARVKSVEKRFIASKEALDTVIKEEE